MFSTVSSLDACIEVILSRWGQVDGNDVTVFGETLSTLWFHPEEDFSSSANMALAYFNWPQDGIDLPE